MSTEQLVTMLNDIAAFFDAASDDGERAQSVATHMRRYWDPRMRKQIVQHVASGGEGLAPVARAAVELLAAEQRG
ncbi:MAG TPA: formate dehydrogenase subunit delta [Gammaproteobacteria bacterium]|nr:formate dehydrogenase subunit delta [Gammaproteobacteria bacterium]